MTILSETGDDPTRIRELWSTIRSYQAPFKWDMPQVDMYIRNQSDKCEVIEEEHQFQWTRFVPHLILSYELCQKMNDYTRALEHISWCIDHWNELQRTCKEPLFQSLREVIAHVILATKATILLASGNVDLARKEVDLLSKYPYGDVKNLRSTKNRAGLLGLKAAAYLQYRAGGCHQALEAAKEARALDPDQAEWWFIIGLSLGRIRRQSKNEEVISTEEIEAIEKAFSLQKDASYTVQLAQMYADYSRKLFFKREYEKERTYAIKAATRFREALEIRPNCANLKARVAHGMIKIRHKDASDVPLAKNLLEEVVKTSPNRSMAFADLGFYYSQIEKDIEKEIFYYQKSFEAGNNKSIGFLSQAKWKIGLEEQIVADIEEGLTKYLSAEDQAMLQVYRGVCHILINDNWEAAVPCFQKSLDLDPSAQYMERFSGFDGKKVNLLELITNHLHFRADDENQKSIKSFLAYIAQNKPQNVQFGCKNKFLYWKKELEEQKVRRPSESKASIQVADAKQNEANEGDIVGVDNQGSLRTLSSQMAELILSVNKLATNLATKEEVKSIVADVEVIREDVDVVNDKVSTLESRVTVVEVHLEGLESKVETLERGVSGGLSPEEMISEVNDRVRRAPNIILHNLPENIDEPIEIRIANDKDLVFKVARAMNHALDTTEIKLRRIGKPVGGRCRPLIVTFKTANEAKMFLEHLSVDSVKGADPALADIGVSRDKTVRERQHLRSLREELENRVSRGESTLTIKFRNGVPKIVSKY